MQTALTELAELFATTTARITPEQLDRPTPCTDFTVRQLLAHLGGVLPDSERAAHKLPRPAAPAAALTEPVAVGESARRAAAAWQVPSALDGDTLFGPGEMPAGFAAAVTLQELALHGWDLARAAGVDYVPGEVAAETVLAVVEQLAERARANGSYGPALPAPADSAAFERALAASGRNPGWAA
ncbi:TIGR03086 family protein [Kitasatospora aureofaciens]|uniref:TIGR03086 family metal-binding protein n=1 Tax=Kitasatospora aureofaciens TaxID=1894 RepID=UPI001C440425|nr:TIGR03086 family metal-binding protein [Kitasatospora aureofaciens]MBV6696674.1 TIGR03086 family protein [Kitasatospora aureofaciens]